MTSKRENTPSALAAAAAGIAATLLGAGLGELAAGIFAPGGSPFASIGSVMIDAAPAWAKDTAIALFGTGDKTALLVGIGIALLVVAALAGILEVRWRRTGRGILLALGVAGTVAASTRAGADALAAIPSLISGTVAAFALWLLLIKATDAAGASASATDERTSRRSFLALSGIAAVGGVLAAAGGSALRATSKSVQSVRSALRVPAAATPAPAIRSGANLTIEGLTPYITPNANFYRIDTALVVPQLDPATWSIRIHGLVENEITLTWNELVSLPLQESVTTLTCVSNEVGGDLIGNAVWRGYPIRELLARAKPTSKADMVLSTSSDGFTASTPLEALTDDREAILAVAMNGEPLPIEHGFPVRMVVPGLYGYVSATKWVTDLEVTTFSARTGYWTDRGWSARGPVKLQSRIDVPRSGASMASGKTMIAGVAWQQHVGVSAVEVQIDGGAWQKASFASAVSNDTWVQWSLPWDAPAGEHTIRCRAISTAGETQTSQQAPPAPDGATGWDERQVSVG